MIVNARGISLVEMIVAMTALSIVMVLVVNVIVQHSVQSADPMLSLRASELGRAWMDEISNKAFDENGDLNSGTFRCDEAGQAQCSAIDDCDAVPSNREEANREDFDDVDDYHCLSVSGSDIENSLGVSSGSLYSGYSVTITVGYDGDFDGVLDDGDVSSERVAKLIIVAVTPPTSLGSVDNFTLRFASYRANY